MTRIENVLIVDGSGAPGYPGELLLDGERIAEIGSTVSREACELVINGDGLVAAPGFIDMHGHNDLRVFDDPALKPKLLQGITTEVIGQDGISMAPLPMAYVEEWKRNLAEFDGTSDSIPWSYRNTAGYLSSLDAIRPAANYCYMVPHGNVRLEALGLENRPPTSADLRRMRDILRRELEAGAFGLSTGLIYAPCSYAGIDELVALCTVVKEYGGVFMIHQRSESDDILASMEEVVEIGRRSGVHVHFSHFKVCGKKNEVLLDGMFRILDAAVAEGLAVTFDQYPYPAGSTSLGMILPPWAHEGGVSRLLERLERVEDRRRMREDIEGALKGWDNFVDFAGFDGIFLTSAASLRNKAYVGKSLAEIAELQGKTPYDAAFDLILQEENGAGMVDFYGTETMVSRIMSRPEMRASTDGILDEKPHPRVYGAFPRILGKYVREEKVLGLEEAVRKMTGASAAVLGLEDRGILTQGNYADLALFDSRTVRDLASFETPTLYPEGIAYVFVNGTLAVRDGVYAGGRSGRVVRRGGDGSPGMEI